MKKKKFYGLTRVEGTCRCKWKIWCTLVFVKIFSLKMLPKILCKPLVRLVSHSAPDVCVGVVVVSVGAAAPCGRRWLARASHEPDSFHLCRASMELSMGFIAKLGVYGSGHVCWWSHLWRGPPHTDRSKPKHIPDWRIWVTATGTVVFYSILTHLFIISDIYDLIQELRFFS